MRNAVNRLSVDFVNLTASSVVDIAIELAIVSLDDNVGLGDIVDRVLSVDIIADSMANYIINHQ